MRTSVGRRDKVNEGVAKTRDLTKHSQRDRIRIVSSRPRCTTPRHPSTLRVNAWPKLPCPISLATQSFCVSRAKEHSRFRRCYFSSSARRVPVRPTTRFAFYFRQLQADNPVLQGHRGHNGAIRCAWRAFDVPLPRNSICLQTPRTNLQHSPLATLSGDDLT